MLFGADLIFSLIVFSWHAMVEQSTILIYYTISKIILFLQCVSIVKQTTVLGLLCV